MTNNMDKVDQYEIAKELVNKYKISYNGVWLTKYCSDEDIYIPSSLVDRIIVEKMQELNMKTNMKFMSEIAELMMVVNEVEDKTKSIEDHFKEFYKDFKETTPSKFEDLLEKL